MRAVSSTGGSLSFRRSARVRVRWDDAPLAVKFFSRQLLYCDHRPCFIATLSPSLLHRSSVRCLCSEPSEICPQSRIRLPLLVRLSSPDSLTDRRTTCIVQMDILQATLAANIRVVKYVPSYGEQPNDVQNVTKCTSPLRQWRSDDRDVLTRRYVCACRLQGQVPRVSRTYSSQLCAYAR